MCPDGSSPQKDHIVITELHYDPSADKANGALDADEGKYEWIELFNPTDDNIDIKNWTITATGSSPITIITSNFIIPSKKFVIIIPDSRNLISWSTELTGARWNEYELGRISEDDYMRGIYPLITNTLDQSNFVWRSKPGLTQTSLYNPGDSVTIKNEFGNAVDGMSWGDDKSIFNLRGATEGSSLERVDIFCDTDTAADFQESSPSPGTKY